MYRPKLRESHFLRSMHIPMKAEQGWEYKRHSPNWNIYKISIFDQECADEENYDEFPCAKKSKC